MYSCLDATALARATESPVCDHTRSPSTRSIVHSLPCSQSESAIGYVATLLGFPMPLGRTALVHPLVDFSASVETAAPPSLLVYPMVRARLADSTAHPEFQRFRPSATPRVAPVPVFPIFAISSPHFAIRGTLVSGCSLCSPVHSFRCYFNYT